MNTMQTLAKERFRLFMALTDSIEQHIANQQMSAEINHAMYLANKFQVEKALEQLTACAHGLVHCPICSAEQPWPSRANRGDLIP